MSALMDLWQKMSALIVWSLLLFCHWQMREKVFVEKRVLACQKELFSGARETSFWNDQGTSQGESLPNAATLIFEAQIKKTAEVGHKSAKHLCFNLGRLGAVGVTMGCAQSSKHPLRNSVSYLIYSNALGFHWCMLKISSDSFKKRETLWQRPKWIIFLMWPLVQTSLTKYATAGRIVSIKFCWRWQEYTIS